MKKILTALLFLIPVTSYAQQQPVCKPGKQVEEELKAEYKQYKVISWLAQFNNQIFLMHIFANFETDTYTVVREDPNRMCAVGAGVGIKLHDPVESLEEF